MGGGAVSEGELRCRRWCWSAASVGAELDPYCGVNDSLSVCPSMLMLLRRVIASSAASTLAQLIAPDADVAGPAEDIRPLRSIHADAHRHQR